MKLLSKTLMLSLLITAPSYGDALCFACDRSDWNNMDSGTKHGFVMGSIQSQVYMVEGADNTYVQDLRRCLLDMRLNSADLVDIVDNQYTDLAKWEHQPDIVLSMGVRQVCLAAINRARAKRGQEPLSP
jgi:hypothetical protein